MDFLRRLQILEGQGILHMSSSQLSRNSFSRLGVSLRSLLIDFKRKASIFPSQLIVARAVRGGILVIIASSLYPSHRAILVVSSMNRAYYYILEVLTYLLLP